MPNIGPTELLLVLIVAVLLLGPRRLPEAGRAAGRALRGYRHALRGEDVQHEAAETPADGSPK